MFLLFLPGQIPSTVSSPIKSNTKWKQNGVTIAEGNGKGDQLNQLSAPNGIYVDDDHQCVYITDTQNHRIVQWKSDAKIGRVVAGGNGQGGEINQLSHPTNVIVEKRTDSLIICDMRNKRVVRWPRQNGTSGQTIISDIDCSGIATDNNGDLYVSDWRKNEVRRWKIGETNGTLAAGGNGRGDRHNQLASPAYLFVDEDHSVYVSDYSNHRVMKWVKGGKEGTIVAGGQGQGKKLTQLDNPLGVVVDHLGNVYVADTSNNRIVCWPKGAKEGRLIVGGNMEGQEADAFCRPLGLSFDRQGHLYVVDQGNNRVQKFEIDTS